MAVFAKSYFFCITALASFWNKTAITSFVLFTINAGERPRTAAFGSGPQPVLGSANGLRPLPSASFKEGACSSFNNKKTVALASAGIPEI